MVGHNRTYSPYITVCMVILALTLALCMVALITHPFPALTLRRRVLQRHCHGQLH